MRKSAIFAILVAVLLATPLSAGAATNSLAKWRAECQTQAKKKYSLIHLLKRRAFVRKCMRQSEDMANRESFATGQH